MPLTDEQLLDFDVKELGGLRRTPNALLAEHGDAYRQQLVMALHLDGWANRHEEHRDAWQRPLYDEGYVEALRTIAAHCRQGDYLPGGSFYDDTTGGRP